jgi:hypothetical protein
MFKTFIKIFAFCKQKKQKLFLFSFVFYMFLLFFSIKKIHKQKKIFFEKIQRKRKKVQKNSCFFLLRFSSHRVALLCIM